MDGEAAFLLLDLRRALPAFFTLRFAVERLAVDPARLEAALLFAAGRLAVDRFATERLAVPVLRATAFLRAPVVLRAPAFLAVVLFTVAFLTVLFLAVPLLAATFLAPVLAFLAPTRFFAVDVFVPLDLLLDFIPVLDVAFFATLFCAILDLLGLITITIQT